MKFNMRRAMQIFTAPRLRRFARCFAKNAAFTAAVVVLAGASFSAAARQKVVQFSPENIEDEVEYICLGSEATDRKQRITRFVCGLKTMYVCSSGGVPRVHLDPDAMRDCYVYRARHY